MSCGSTPHLRNPRNAPECRLPVTVVTVNTRERARIYSRSVSTSRGHASNFYGLLDAGERCPDFPVARSKGNSRALFRAQRKKKKRKKEERDQRRCQSVRSRFRFVEGLIRRRSSLGGREERKRGVDACLENDYSERRDSRRKVGDSSLCRYIVQTGVHE